MQKTVNPETKRPYTLSMIEKLMHGIHFSVDPHNRSNSKKQICEMEPILLGDYDVFVRRLHGRLEILAVSVHLEKDTNVEHYDDHWDVIEPSHHPLVPLSTEELDEIKLSEVSQKQAISPGNGADKKQSISTRNDGADKKCWT
ncbi:ribosome maturation protein SBDS-like isoform X2 [Papaver somniferum]|uniref:ribosome maturation protein SBDS-like isoform X2 n=1 Tax=Papaver somniferum TaxID=3469 RepID=UPI000E7016C7|nr:ribosome maturation protein SBDS-like isoform X2 [Papaver somniferum]